MEIIRNAIQRETVGGGIEGCVAVEFDVCESPEEITETRELLLGLGGAELQLPMDLIVEVLQEFRAGVPEGRLNLRFEVVLQLIEGGVYLGRCAAGLVNRRGSRFSKSTPDSRAPSTSSEAPKTPSKSLNFSSSSSKTRWSASIATIEEIDDDHVVLLAVAVTAADPLLDALRVPRQVVVHDQVAELEVHPLGRRLGGDHDRGAVAGIPRPGPSGCRPWENR